MCVLEVSPSSPLLSFRVTELAKHIRIQILLRLQFLGDLWWYNVSPVSRDVLCMVSAFKHSLSAVLAAESACGNNCQFWLVA